MATRMMGTSVAFGLIPVQPIADLPAGVLQVKLRQRADRPVTAYLRYADRIEKWVLKLPAAPAVGPWSLLFMQARNVTAKPQPAPTDVPTPPKAV